MIAGCVLHAGRHVCRRVSAPGVRHHLPPLLGGDDLEPEQDQPGHLRGRPGSTRPHSAQEEEVNSELNQGETLVLDIESHYVSLFRWHLLF